MGQRCCSVTFVLLMVHMLSFLYCNIGVVIYHVEVLLKWLFLESIPVLVNLVPNRVEVFLPRSHAVVIS